MAAPVQVRRNVTHKDKKVRQAEKDIHFDHLHETKKDDRHCTQDLEESILTVESVGVSLSIRNLDVELSCAELNAPGLKDSMY